MLTDLMNPLQFGLRKVVCTADALLFSIKSVPKSIDSNNIVQIALLDLSKAFRSVSHDISKKPRKRIGLDSDAQNLIKIFFLTDFSLQN